MAVVLAINPNNMDLKKETGHDSNACLLINGKISRCFIEERYNRKKHYGDFPKMTLDSIATSISGGIINSALHPKVNKYIKDNFQIEHINYNASVDHHLFHAYESFYTSNFESAAILVIDGYGSDEKESISIYKKNKKETKLLKRYYMDESIGLFYTAVCNKITLGKEYGVEGKLMGLSSYGNPSDKRLLEIDDNYKIKINDNIKMYPFNSAKDSNIIHYINIAATAQRDFNEVIMQLIKLTKELTGEDNLCLSGGCFLNVIVNNLICESEIFKNVWCSPFPNDGGISTGMAYVIEEKSNPEFHNYRLTSPYLGEKYPDFKILSYLKENNIAYRETNKEEIAKLLSEDKILFWFQGRSEYGPRALGHRSIIGNPANRDNFYKTNNYIKERENWRPLAPTVPNELFKLLFDTKNEQLTEFMLRNLTIKEEWRAKIPAVCHIDNTTRPQNLKREINPEFYDTIMEFYKLTGTPCVINTSLNGKGEPIVETPKNCLDFYQKKKEYVYGIIFNGKYLVTY